MSGEWDLDQLRAANPVSVSGAAALRAALSLDDRVFSSLAEDDGSDAGVASTPIRTSRLRSGPSLGRRRFAWTRASSMRRRGALVAAAAAVAVLVPLLALAAANDWWFFSAPGSSEIAAPVNKPVVVATGTWSGQAWKLVAFNSRGTGTCWGVSYDNPSAKQDVIAQLQGPGVASGSGNALACGSIVGIRLPHIHEDFSTIMWLIARSQSNAVPGWIAGPVISSVRTVVIYFDNGASVHAPTYAPPESLGRLRWFHPIRFYAAPLPRPDNTAEPTPFPQRLVGFDANGRIVACSLGFGYSPPSACKR